MKDKPKPPQIDDLLALPPDALRARAELARLVRETFAEGEEWRPEVKELADEFRDFENKAKRAADAQDPQ